MLATHAQHAQECLSLSSPRWKCESRQAMWGCSGRKNNKVGAAGCYQQNRYPERLERFTLCTSHFLPLCRINTGREINPQLLWGRTQHVQPSPGCLVTLEQHKYALRSSYTLSLIISRDMRFRTSQLCSLYTCGITKLVEMFSKLSLSLCLEKIHALPGRSSWEAQCSSSAAVISTHFTKQALRECRVMFPANLQRR